MPKPKTPVVPKAVRGLHIPRGWRLMNAVENPAFKYGDKFWSTLNNAWNFTGQIGEISVANSLGKYVKCYIRRKSKK